MKIHLFIALATLSLLRLCMASEPQDCNEPRNTNACEARSMVTAKADLESFVVDLHKKLGTYIGHSYADQLDIIQRQWMSWADRQCEHSRGIYGKGSEGALSVITCHELLYKDRLQELKRIYEDILQQR